MTYFKMLAMLLAVGWLAEFGPAVQAAVIFDDDFDDEASADPPGGWTQTSASGGGTHVSEETSATSAVTISSTSATGTTRIMSTGTTFDPNSGLPTTITAEINSFTAGTLGIGISDDTSLSNTFIFFLAPTGTVTALTHTTGNSFETISIGTVAGYAGGAITMTADLSTTGFQVTADVGGFDSGFTLWSTFTTSGFTSVTDLGNSNIAMMQRGGAPGSAEVDRLTVSNVPEPTGFSLLAISLLSICPFMGRRRKKA